MDAAAAFSGVTPIPHTRVSGFPVGCRLAVFVVLAVSTHHVRPAAESHHHEEEGAHTSSQPRLFRLSVSMVIFPA